MKYFSKIFLYITLLFLIFWQLPWCYNFFFDKPSRTPFSMYSCVIGDFLSMGYEDNVGLIRRDQSGNNYTQEQTDSILPLFYVRQLMADERFPDTIMGVPVNARDVQLTNFIFRTSASEINSSTIPLYPLLESMSGRVDLEMPDDVFRITKNGIEFIVMNTNTIDSTKSLMFTKTFKKKGFKFPAHYVAGNPTTRKEYDEGYLILDCENKLFHLKQLKARPYVRPIDLPEGLNAKYLFITEFRDHKTLGYITDENNNFYVLNKKTYEVVKAGIPSYNPEMDNISIFGNMFDWTVCIKTKESEKYYALDANDYSLIKSMEFPLKNHKMFGLHFTTSRDKYVKLRFY